MYVVWRLSPSSTFLSFSRSEFSFLHNCQVALVFDGEETVVGAFYVKYVRGYERREEEHEENGPRGEERAQEVHLLMVICF